MKYVSALSFFLSPSFLLLIIISLSWAWTQSLTSSKAIYWYLHPSPLSLCFPSLLSFFSHLYFSLQCYFFLPCHRCSIYGCLVSICGAHVEVILYLPLVQFCLTDAKITAVKQPLIFGTLYFLYCILVICFFPNSALHFNGAQYCLNTCVLTTQLLSIC